MNRAAQWHTYQVLERQIDKAWGKLRQDIRRGANPQALTRGRNNLMLLLGECNYMARECNRIVNRAQR